MSKVKDSPPNHKLGYLMELIHKYSIALPDLQRPFVWKKTQVRDLFDSMYQGYPVGVLVFWKVANEKSHSKKFHFIRTDGKKRQPNLLVLDGQQRLTSLYAVIKEEPIETKNGKKELIKIVFNPREEKFVVQDAANKNAKEFIDISTLWERGATLIEIRDKYLKNNLGSEVDKAKIEKNIETLKKLPDEFQFTCIELDENIEEEDAADIFVRMNSKGKSLKTSDFIFTLMSVHWDKGRKKLEKICKEARKSSKSKEASFHNELFEVTPEFLLKAALALAFKQVKMKYLYQLLLGKDMATGESSPKKREEQFELLKQAQKEVLNSQYWHDFLKCIMDAGYINKRMIPGENNLVFCYILYLIGKEKNIKEPILKRTISRWFFMSNITQRYGSSVETIMEGDLKKIKGIKSGTEFIARLEEIIETALPDSIWDTTLPKEHLTKTGTGSFAFHAYEAALVKLHAKVLFSLTEVTTLIPTLGKRVKKAAIERHHLFPKAYLEKKRWYKNAIDQTANFTYVEWYKDIEISDAPPSKYVPEEKKKLKETLHMTDKEIKKMEKDHALPGGWENMDYKDFLEERRKLMAKIIKKGYEKL